MVIILMKFLLYLLEVMVKNCVFWNDNYKMDDFFCVSICDEDLFKLLVVRGSVDFVLDEV